MMRLVKQAGENEICRYALEELIHYVRVLFGADVVVEHGLRAGEADSPHGFAVCLRPPVSGDGNVPVMPVGSYRLSKQGFLIRRTDPYTLWLVGGSPEALLWAVYELVEQWGVAYTLQGDVFPDNRRELWLPALDRVFEPRQRIRSWCLMNEWYIGAVSWSLPQQLRLIKQLVKQKYNGIYFIFYPQHPFVDFHMDGVAKSSALFNFGFVVPLTEDNIGRGHLPAGDRFENPEFLSCRNSEDMCRTGIRYIREIIRSAKFFNMHVCFSLQFFDFPKEFAPLLQKSGEVYQAGSLTVAEEGDIYNAAHLRLLETQFDAYLHTYGEVDEFEIALPEHSRSNETLESVWEKLDSRFHLSAKHDVYQALYEMETAEIAAGGKQRAIDEGKMTLEMLHVLHVLLDRTQLLRKLKEKGKQLSLAAGLSCPALLPIVADTLWEGGCLRLITGYTSSRAVRNLRVLERLDNPRIRVEQVITLQDDNVGGIPQLAASSIHRLMEYACEHGWDGYVTRFFPTGDLDPVSAYLAQASWDAAATAESAYERHIGQLYGPVAVGPLRQAFRLLEDATLLLDMELSLMIPIGGIITRHIKPGAQVMSPYKWHALNLFLEVKQLLERSVDQTARSGRDHLLYWIARVSFAASVLRGLAKIQDGNACETPEEASRLYREAVGCFRSGLDSLAGCVRDDSDRGILATGYHLLVREVCQAIDGKEA